MANHAMVLKLAYALTRLLLIDHVRSLLRVFRLSRRQDRHRTVAQSVPHSSLDYKRAVTGRNDKPVSHPRPGPRPPYLERIRILSYVYGPPGRGDGAKGACASHPDTLAVPA